jgi:hypothetical protein
LTKKSACLILLQEIIMPETKSLENNVPPAPRDPGSSPVGTPVSPDQTQHFPQSEIIKAPSPGAGKEDAAITKPPAEETKPAAMHPEQAPMPARPKYIWAILPIGLLLAILLVLLSTRSRQKESLKNMPVRTQNVEEKQELSNYSAFIAQNKALRDEKHAEQILTDEIFAGEAPLTEKANGPVITSEIDPQLAALAEALKIRVQVMQGSQTLARGKSATRIIKGEFRGFKVNALEKLENGVVIADEIRVETPKNGLIKTVNHVLETVQKTDFPGLLSEIRNAGLEFSPSPVPSGKNVFRGQIRPLGHWGKPVAGEFLISGKSVGEIALGMPVDRMKNQMIASYIVLKRKVLVNDVYYDVYKILDRGNEPLLYVYEKGNKVWGISIVSEAFKTEKWIGIGNTLDQMRINYPFIKLAYSEKKTPFVQVDDVAGIFIIQGDGEKKIISILVGDSPEFE